MDEAHYQQLINNQQADLPNAIKCCDKLLPKQGVKISSQHIIYDSDGLSQIRLSIITQDNKIYQVNYVEKGAFGNKLPLLWQDNSVPKGITMQLIDQ